MGFTSLTIEIYGIKVIESFFAQSSYSSAIVISSFLGGLAFSCLYFSKYSNNAKDSRKWAIILSSLFFFYSLFLLPQISTINLLITYAVENLNLVLLEIIKISLFWFFLFIPAFFFGGVFPLSMGMMSTNKKNNNNVSLSRIYFFDTLGGIIGSLLTGTLFIPLLGLHQTLLFSTITTIAAILLLLKSMPLRLTVSFCYLLLILFKINSIQLQSQIDLTKITDYQFGDKILFQEESKYGKVTVAETLDKKTQIPYRTLFIDYRNMCHTNIAKSLPERALGQFTLDNLKNEKSKVLSIGLGCGITASVLASGNNVEKLDVVEINPTVIKANKIAFQKDNSHLLQNTKVSVLTDDGAIHLSKRKSHSLDAIVIDIEESSVVHSSPLFTSEYIKNAKLKLLPGGFISFWTFYTNASFSKVLVNTFRENFQHVFFRILNNAIILFASDNPLNIPLPDSNSEVTYLNDIEQSKVMEINTLDNKALEKYFDTNLVFSNPKWHRDQLEVYPNKITAK